MRQEKTMATKPTIHAVKKKQPQQSQKKNVNVKKIVKKVKIQKKKGNLAPIMLCSVLLLGAAAGLTIFRTTVDFYYIDESLIEFPQEKSELLLSSEKFFIFQNINAPELKDITDDNVDGWSLTWTKDVDIDSVSFNNMGKKYKWYANLIDNNKEDITIDIPIQTGEEYVSNYGDYYDALSMVSASELHVRLNEGFKATSYNDAGKGEMLIEADTPNGADYVYGVYNGQQFERDWMNGKNFEREHVWPNARLGMVRVTSTGKNQASDLHNLRAIGGVHSEVAINQRRSDRFFEDCSSMDVHGPHTFGNDAFCLGKGENGDKVGEHRGDVARIFMYMFIKYGMLKIANTRNELTNYTPYSETETYMPLWGAGGTLATLLEWNRLDPVDSFERHRNDVIYQFQGNRNPFIDHPEWAEILWHNV